MLSILHMPLLLRLLEVLKFFYHKYILLIATEFPRQNFSDNFSNWKFAVTAKKTCETSPFV